jgi:hypothetical protein
MPRQIQISTDKGRMEVPASPSFNEIPDLAVTMTQFGYFEVTHVRTGLKFGGRYERYANAACAMAYIQLAFDELEINTDCSQEEFYAQYKDKPCKVLDGMSLKQWLDFTSQGLAVAGEFPWESEEDCPHSQFHALLKRIGK